MRQDTLDKIMRRSQRLSYRLRGGTVPIEKLSAALPEVLWEPAADGSSLTATFPENYSTEQLNAVVLRVLLDAGVGILEIQRGTGLESEYLRLAASPPPMPSSGRSSA